MCRLTFAGRPLQSQFRRSRFVNESDFPFLMVSRTKIETEEFIVTYQDGVHLTLVYRSRVLGALWYQLQELPQILAIGYACLVYATKATFTDSMLF